MNSDQLNEILKLHQLWLDEKPEGQRADLTGADLTGADLRGAYLSRADLREANLSEANLSRANLTGVDLRGANLGGAYLRDAGLSRASIFKADLCRADLRGACLDGADLGHVKDIYSFTLGAHFGFYQVSTNYCQIGCEGHSLEHWLENYVAIGANAEYTEVEIKAYGMQLKLIYDLTKGAQS